MKWKPTMELRFVERVHHDTGNVFKIVHHYLQQKWIRVTHASDFGAESWEEEWRDVPVEGE